MDWKGRAERRFRRHKPCFRGADAARATGEKHGPVIEQGGRVVVSRCHRVIQHIENAVGIQFEGSGDRRASSAHNGAARNKHLTIIQQGSGVAITRHTEIARRGDARGG